MLKPVKILSKMYDVPEGWTLRAYERAGGYQAARKALGMPQATVVDETKKDLCNTLYPPPPPPMP